MKITQPSLRFALFLTALPLALPLSAEAGAYLSATSGSGPDSYRSNEITGNADLFDTPLSVNAYVFKSTSSAAEDVSQSTIGLDWKVSKLVKLGVKHDKVDNGSIDILGNSLSLALSLNTLWNSDLLTRVDLKVAGSAYRFSDLPPAVKNDTINQTASSFGLIQDITGWLSLNAGRDSYSYDRNPVNAAAVLMLRAPRKYVNTSSNLLSFPDSTNRFGLSLRPLESLTIDISSSKTTTLLDQVLNTKLLGVNYQVTDHLNVYAAVSKATSTAVVTKRAYTVLVPAGTSLMPATDNTYTEFSLGWTF